MSGKPQPVGISHRAAIRAVIPSRIGARLPKKAELAAMLGISERAAMVHLHKALGELGLITERGKYGDMRRLYVSGYKVSPISSLSPLLDMRLLARDVVNGASDTRIEVGR